MPNASSNVRVRGQGGKHLLVLSSSQFDPNRKSSNRANAFRLAHERHYATQSVCPFRAATLLATHRPADIGRGSPILGKRGRNMDGTMSALTSPNRLSH